MNFRVGGIILLILLFFFSGCENKPSIQRLQKSLSGSTMGTTYVVKIVYSTKDTSKSKYLLEKIGGKIDSVLQFVNGMMSTYIQDSEISRFNNFSDTNWFPISKEFAEVVSAALKIGEQTDGALDITVEPLVNLWGFGPKEKRTTIPDSQEVRTLLGITGIDKIKINDNPVAIKKSVPETEIDLSSIAKGYGVDKTAEFLLENGFTDFMIEVGGEIRASGKNANNEKWRLGISNPADKNKIIKVVSFSEKSLATSGSYYNFFEYKGKTYSHTINPKTGFPVTHNLVSVSVIHSSCMYADGYATAIDVLGPKKGLKFAEKMELPVYLISKKNDSLIFAKTKQFEKFIEIERR